jgi:hypothetical protein
MKESDTRLFHLSVWLSPVLYMIMKTGFGFVRREDDQVPLSGAESLMERIH